MNKETFIKVKNLSKSFTIQKKTLHAVRNVNLHIHRGETLGLVGESGCGKTTVGRSIMRLYEPSSGNVLFDGIDLSILPRRALKKTRQRMQMIFQDPYASLNPRMTVQEIIAEPLEIHNLCKRGDYYRRCQELLEIVGLNPNHLSRFPHEFSGGQRQRIGIARALAVEPEFIVCDEPISALDVSVQAQVVNLLRELQQKMNLTYLFIAHDLAMVRYISDRVAVMYLGQIVEIATSDDLYKTPKHPYTQALLASIPIPDPVVERERPRVVVKGELPNPLSPPKGCAFHTRCPKAKEVCRLKEPRLQQVAPGHFTACHLF